MLWWPDPSVSELLSNSLVCLENARKGRNGQVESISSMQEGMNCASSHNVTTGEPAFAVCPPVYREQHTAKVEFAVCLIQAHGKR